MPLPLGQPEEEAPDLDAGRAFQREFEPSRGEVRETFQEALGPVERHALRHVLQQLDTARSGIEIRMFRNPSPQSVAVVRKGGSGRPSASESGPGAASQAVLLRREGLRQVQPVRPYGQWVEPVKLDRALAREGEFRCASLFFQRGGSPNQQVRPHAGWGHPCGTIRESHGAAEAPCPPSHR